MRRVVILLSFIVLAASVSAQDYRYWISGGGGIVSPLKNESAGDLERLNRHGTFGGGAGLRLGDGWLFDASISYARLRADYSYGARIEHPDMYFKALRVGGMLQRFVFASQEPVNLFLGVGGGMMQWKFQDSEGWIPQVAGDKGQQESFKAAELFVSAGSGVDVRIAKPLLFRAYWTTDYLTGAGARFASSINTARPRWFGTGGISLNFLFGSVNRQDTWASDSAWQSPGQVGGKASPIASVDSDGDGVADNVDKCLATPRGVEVDRNGCPKDTDGDGVPDGLDDCANTPAAARGRVDIYGCAVDSDFDGIPDYLDSCPNNPVGAQVDEKGCPKDGDADGVPDGLDDCPNSLAGIPVDKYGCVDASMFSKPMVLRPDYEPGSFEVDARTKAKLEQLARALTQLPEIRLEISAFTDDIGNDAANQALSERRAVRIKDYLVVYGVPKERIAATGRGESSFVASNQTAEGRAKNRRIEIVFHK